LDPSDLRAEVRLELDRIDTVTGELQKLAQDVEDREPTVRERAAAGAFLADFHMGVEHILERIMRYHGLERPRSERWHIELFQQFCPPATGPLPALFPEELAEQMRPYRRFRHVVHHGYGFELEWSRMKEGIEQADEVRQQFGRQVQRYLDTLSSQDPTSERDH
jgi:hypothetical protein